MVRNSLTPGSGSTNDGTRARLHANFDSNDLNHDGRLTLGEFIHFLGSTDEEMTAEEYQTAFDEIDTNRDGLIDFAQFLTWWNEQA